MPSLNFEQVIDLDKPVRLLNDNVLIETFDTRAYQNGVYVPITEMNTFVPFWGTVIAVCDDEQTLKTGDNVIFEKYKGERFISPDKKRTFLMIKRSMVLAVFDGIL